LIGYKNESVADHSRVDGLVGCTELKILKNNPCAIFTTRERGKPGVRYIMELIEGEKKVA
jgi:hypothetical protein